MLGAVKATLPGGPVFRFETVSANCRQGPRTVIGLILRPKTAPLLMRLTLEAGECPSIPLRTKYRGCVHLFWQAR
jgi:hypothetical protein